MSAGVPNFQKLHEMGKLPESARGNVPMLAQLDAASKRVNELEKENKELKDKLNEPVVSDGDGPTPPEPPLAPEPENVPVITDPVNTKQEGEGSVVVRCEVVGCGYSATGRTEGIARNMLRMHGKAHAPKQ